MEALLRLSGLLTDEDGDKTDLGTLEKRLADRGFSDQGLSHRDSKKETPTSSTNHTLDGSRQTTPHLDQQSSPQTTVTSPEAQEKSEEEVENLSDMMCSLVTNNCGETRYIGMS